ncbi:hypothetical protein L7F22_010034 [Adiantum nelumboides]|nr:hypothetical protein [Adiantum nelumboides]
MKFKLCCACSNTKAMSNMSSFFAQPWFTLIFHDKFLDFYSELCLDVYRFLNQLPESQNLIQHVVKDAYVMFLNTYKVDFPELNFSSSWFSSKAYQHPWNALGESDSTTRSHSKARARKQDNEFKELKGSEGEKEQKLSKEDNKVLEAVPVDSSWQALVPENEVQASSSEMKKEVAEQSEERNPSLQAELVLAVENIVEEIMRGQLTTGTGRSKQLSDKAEIEMVVENIVNHLLNSEAMKVSATGLLDGASAQSLIEVEVELIVRQMVENLTGHQAVNKNGSPTVRVRLTFAKGSEGSVLVEKVQVKLLVENEFSSSSSGLSHCSDASKILEEQNMVNVRLLVATAAAASEDDEKLVKVQLEYPQIGHGGTRLSSAVVEKTEDFFELGKRR